MPEQTTTSRSSLLGLFGIVVVLILLAVWSMSQGFQELQTSTLQTSLNKLSSTQLQLSIPEAGRLHIELGPSSTLDDATIFTMTMRSSEANPLITPPFIVPSELNTLVNTVNINDDNELILAVVFPENYFKQKKKLAELPFLTSEIGEFEVTRVYLGNTPQITFPPSQEFPIFLDSPFLEFDENGESLIPIVPDNQGGQTEETPRCQDGLDNDGDGFIDFPDDIGCDDLSDDDEEDPVTIKKIKLKIPSQFQVSETYFVLPPAQEQLLYQFTLEATGGESNPIFSVRGRQANQNGAFPLSNSGLVLNQTGVISGEPTTLQAGNYRYQMQLSDGTESLNFTIQVAVNDAFGDPVGLDIRPTFPGSELTCVVGEECEAFFVASKGIAPYGYGFSGESPTGTNPLQINADEAYFRFEATQEMLGSYSATITAFDQSQSLVSTSGSTTDDMDSSSSPSGASNKTSFAFTITIKEPEAEPILGTFKFASEKICEFLDVSPREESYPWFQFTCELGIIEGFEGNVRPFDTLNRAEAAKITALLITSETEVNDTFSPFQNLSPGTEVNYQDVAVSDWFARFVYFLFTEGVIIDNINYRPADTLTVAESLKLVVEAFATHSEDVLAELEQLDGFGDWYEPYQTIASYVNAEISKVDPAVPAQRVWIAELLFKLQEAYPTDKFQ